MTRPSAADVELLEAEAWAQMHTSFAETTCPGFATVARWGRATALAARDVQAVAVNRAIGFGFDHPLDASRLGELRAFYQRAGNTRWFVECSPIADIDHAAFEQAGGRVGGTVIKLVGDLEASAELPSPAVDVVVATKQDASRFMALVGTQLGVPELGRPGIVAPIEQRGWTYYLALHDGNAVAGAAMFVSGAGSWLGLSGTLPDFRNRGAQTALLTRRLQDARRAGCLWTSAETSPEKADRNPSLHNMKRVGLYELYHRSWMRFDEQPSAIPA